MNLRWFSAFRSIEQHPQRQVAGEVFKPVFDARGREQDIRWSKLPAVVAANVLTGASGHEINFVARVRLLRIDAARRVDLDQQTAMLENGGKALSFRSGQTLESFGYGGSDTRIV